VRTPPGWWCSTCRTRIKRVFLLCRALPGGRRIAWIFFVTSATEE